jgi:hypothetical protein
MSTEPASPSVEPSYSDSARRYIHHGLVDGDPIANIDLVADPENNFLVIMKDGKIYKNTAGG